MARKRFTLFTGALCFLIFLKLTSWTTGPQHKAPLPDTTAGKKLSRWLALFGTGKQDDFIRFISEHYSQSLLKEDIAIDRADRQARTYLDTRGFHIRSIESSKDHEIIALAQ